MKRDMDLIRQMLLRVETADTTEYLRASEIAVAGYSAEQLRYHGVLLCSYMKQGWSTAKYCRNVSIPVPTTS